MSLDVVGEEGGGKGAELVVELKPLPLPGYDSQNG